LVISDLTRTEAENFLDNGPLGGRLDEFPTDMIDGLVQSAKGLPLYLEEALRLLMQKKILAIDPESGKFLLRRKFDASEAAFPESVKALVRLR
ncbi:hypothetical protein, partial [Glaesserella parasuis]|uniref:hypothetical protein n=1 Tax=Glaesserella parasuis TaxID=738 RepID=UPI003F2AE6C7